MVILSGFQSKASQSMVCHVRVKTKSVLPGERPRFLHDPTVPGLFPFFLLPADLQADCRSRATLREATSLTMIEFPRPKKNKPTRANPPGEIQHDCRQDCPALPGIIRIAGFSRDHWLPDWCCSFSTTIAGTAPKRHTSPPHGDASSRLITTNVETTAQEMVCCVGRECVGVKVLMSFVYLAASHHLKSQPQRRLVFH